MAPRTTTLLIDPRTAEEVLADFTADLSRLTEPVAPSIRAGILRLVETLATDLEQVAAPPFG